MVGNLGFVPALWLLLVQMRHARGCWSPLLVLTLFLGWRRRLWDLKEFSLLTLKRLSDVSGTNL